MCGAAIYIDIGSVRLVIYNQGFGSQCIKYAFCYGKCRSVGTVQCYLFGLKRLGRYGNKIAYISVSSCRIVYGLSDIFPCSKLQFGNLTVYVVFYFKYDLFFHLLSVGVKQFYSVIIIRIMACTYHNSCRKSFSSYYIGHTWGRSYMKEVHIRT